MLKVVLCSVDDLTRQLAATVLGRAGIDHFKATRLAEARFLASVTCASAILVDRDLPHVEDFVRALRENSATQHRSLAILARGEMEPKELELLELGANALLRLPPDATWDERLARLLNVAPRQEARAPVEFVVETTSGEARLSAKAVNLSATGMLLEADTRLPVFREFDFRCQLPDGNPIAGRGRVIREAGAARFGVEFVQLDERSKESMRQFLRSAAVGTP
jgi:DNA-binding response OmpR family regulator